MFGKFPNDQFEKLKKFQTTIFKICRFGKKSFSVQNGKKIFLSFQFRNKKQYFIVFRFERKKNIYLLSV